MSRSSWKTTILTNSLYNFLNKKQQLSGVSKLSRSQVLTKNLEDKSILVHNGFSFSSLQVTKDMLGFVVGDFVLTRKMRVSEKKKKRNKKR